MYSDCPGTHYRLGLPLPLGLKVCATHAHPCPAESLFLKCIFCFSLSAGSTSLPALTHYWSWHTLSFFFFKIIFFLSVPAHSPPVPNTHSLSSPYPQPTPFPWGLKDKVDLLPLRPDTPGILDQPKCAAVSLRMNEHIVKFSKRNFWMLVWTLLVDLHFHP